MVDFKAYVFHVNRPDLLQRSIDSFPDLQSRLTIVNNSGGILLGSNVFTPPVPLTYAQSMNWMLADAWPVDAILHFHSDAFSENPLAVTQLLDEVRKRRGTRWACLWTFYDILWAINPIAMREIGGWDPEFTAYFTDNDVRRRLEMANWECIDTGITGITHEGSATINSDPELKFMNGITFPLRRQYYIWKWGGEPGKEIFTRPFNR